MVKSRTFPQWNLIGYYHLERYLNDNGYEYETEEIKQEDETLIKITWKEESSE